MGVCSSSVIYITKKYQAPDSERGLWTLLSEMMAVLKYAKISKCVYQDDLERCCEVVEIAIDEGLGALSSKYYFPQINLEGKPQCKEEIFEHEIDNEHVDVFSAFCKKNICSLERWYEFDYGASFRSHVVYDDAGRKIVDDSIDEETMSLLIPDADESDPKTKEAIERYKKFGEPNTCTILPALINEKGQEIDASDFFAETI